MALQCRIELSSGIGIPSTYLKVIAVTGNKEGTTAYVNFYASQKAYLDGKEHFQQIPYSFVPSPEENAVRWDKQAYEYLKTLPEFSEAVDC